MLGQFLFPEGLNGFHKGFAAAFQSVRLLVVLDVTGDIGRQADGHAFGVLVSHVFILTFILPGLRWFGLLSEPLLCQGKVGRGKRAEGEGGGMGFSRSLRIFSQKSSDSHFSIFHLFGYTQA